MLDVIFPLVILVFGAFTVLWILACDHLLKTDSTLDHFEAGTTPAGAPPTASPTGQRVRA